MNLADFLRDTARRIPDHPAIRFEGHSITYAEMNRKVLRVQVSNRAMFAFR
jgi:acyl-CoA synthetase (AMP-forming)/AMP-acid ligase II